MKRLFTIAILLISMSSIAQQIYIIDYVKIGDKEFVPANGVISTFNYVVNITCNDIKSKIVLEKDTYLKDTVKTGETIKTWYGHLAYEDKLDDIYFIVIYFEERISFIINYIDDDQGEIIFSVLK